MGIIERKQREKLQRRNDILDAAEKLFFTQGFERITMDQIARKAELAKGTLYLYFKTREDLHYAIVNRALDLLGTYINKNLKLGGNGAETLLAMGRLYVNFSKQYPGYFRAMMVFDSSKFEKVDQTETLRIFDQGSPLTILFEIVKRGQADGSVRNDILPAELSLILWAHVSSVLELITLRRPLLDYLDLDADTILRRHFDISLNGVIKQ